MSTETPSFSEIIDLHIDLAKAAHFQSMPGRVKSYDAAAQTAIVEPMVKLVWRDVDGQRIVGQLPVLPDMPVMWPRGGGFFLHCPLHVGDSGLIIVTDTDLGAWRHSGVVSDPGDERRHALGGCVFLPGLETLANALVGVSGNAMILGKQSGPTVTIDSSTVQLGAAGGFPVVMERGDPTGLAAFITVVKAYINGVAPGTITTQGSAITASLVKAT